MAKFTFAGTVLSAYPNTRRELIAGTEPAQYDIVNLPGGTILADFKVCNGKAMLNPSLAKVRISDPEAWAYMVQEGLEKGATVSTMASGIHEWDAERDHKMPAKGSLPERKIRRFVGLDLDTTMVAAPAKKFTIETTDDETAARGVRNIVASLAKSALTALTSIVPQAVAGPVEEVQLELK